MSTAIPISFLRPNRFIIVAVLRCFIRDEVKIEKYSLQIPAAKVKRNSLGVSVIYIYIQRHRCSACAIKKHAGRIGNAVRIGNCPATVSSKKKSWRDQATLVLRGRLDARELSRPTRTQVVARVHVRPRRPRLQVRRPACVFNPFSRFSKVGSGAFEGKVNKL